MNLVTPYKAAKNELTRLTKKPGAISVLNCEEEQLLNKKSKQGKRGLCK